MSSYQQGVVAGLQAEFLDQPSGVPVDPTSITLTVLDVNSTVVGGPWYYPGTIVRSALGMYVYDWTIPADLAPADYTVTWSAVINALTRTGYDTVTVLSGPTVSPGPASWASVADVATITGLTVTTGQLMMAQSIIDMAAGRTYAAVSRTGSRDQYWLKLATVYQAAWMLSQPDMFQRMDVQNIMDASGRGKGMALNPTGLVLAPMTRWALKRVTWLKTRSIHIKSSFVDGLSPMSPNASSAANDFFESWSGMD